jgi:hypothetical protein
VIYSYGTARQSYSILMCRTSSWSFLTELSPELLLLTPNIPNISMMPLRLFTKASRLVKNTSRMPQDWTKSAGLRIVLNMSNTVWRSSPGHTVPILSSNSHGYSGPNYATVHHEFCIIGRNRLKSPIKWPDICPE